MGNMIDALVSSITNKIKNNNLDNIKSKKECIPEVIKEDEVIIFKGCILRRSDLEDRIIEKYSEELEGKSTKDVVRIIVKAVFDEISTALANKETVQIHKFGRFVPKFIKGKEGYNYAKQTAYVSKDKYKPKFEPSDVLIELVAPVDQNK